MKPSATIVFIGTGAVQGSWDPVIRAMQGAGFPDVVTPGGANFAMARLIYIGRELWRNGEGRRARKLRKKFRAKLKELKHSIAAALKAASEAREISVREEFARVLEVVFCDAERAAVVTTNWDRTVEQEVARLQPNIGFRYLHGRCEAPEGLYLPTEVVTEPYRKEGARRLLRHRRAEVVCGMQQVSKVVLYGLALSPLDAELGQVLASAMNGSNVQRIQIVDPDYASIAERVAGLTDAANARRVEIVGGPPDQLDLGWRDGPDAENCR